jgi:hypothetical protein
MQSETPTPGAREGGDRYEVVFVNNSPDAGSACLYQVYQQDPGLVTPGVMSLAWFVKEAPPAARVVFEWTMDLCFVWARLGRLKPGNLFKPGQVFPVDLFSANMITFSKQEGDFSFQDPTIQQPRMSLYVRGDGSFLPNQAAVGIGMSGSGMFAAPAQPHWVYTFGMPPQKYRITFGDYRQGQVLDVTQIGSSAEVVFPPGIYSVTATLNRDKSWAVEPNFDGEDR